MRTNSALPICFETILQIISNKNENTLFKLEGTLSLNVIQVNLIANKANNFDTELP